MVTYPTPPDSIVTDENGVARRKLGERWVYLYGIRPDSNSENILRQRERAQDLKSLQRAEARFIDLQIQLESTVERYESQKRILTELKVREGSQQKTRQHYQVEGMKQKINRLIQELYLSEQDIKYWKSKLT